jgi:hypothetical protein
MHPSDQQIKQIKEILDEPCTVDIMLDRVVFTCSSAINASRVTNIAQVVNPLAMVVHVCDDTHLNITIS